MVSPTTQAGPATTARGVMTGSRATPSSLPRTTQSVPDIPGKGVMGSGNSRLDDDGAVALTTEQDTDGSSGGGGGGGKAAAAVIVVLLLVVGTIALISIFLVLYVKKRRSENASMFDCLKIKKSNALVAIGMSISETLS